MNELTEATKTIVLFLRKQHKSIFESSDLPTWYDLDNVKVAIGTFGENATTLEFELDSDKEKLLEQCKEQIASSLFALGTDDSIVSKVKERYCHYFTESRKRYEATGMKGDLDDPEYQATHEKYVSASAWYQHEKWKPYFDRLKKTLNKLGELVGLERIDLIHRLTIQSKSPKLNISDEKARSLWEFLLDEYLHYIPFQNFNDLMQGVGGFNGLSWKCSSKSEIQSLVATLQFLGFFNHSVPPYSSFEEISVYENIPVKNLSSSGSSTYPKHHLFYRFCEELIK